MKHGRTSNPETLHGAALITGASQGLGPELAREFARHGHPLVLVAPDLDRLEELSSAIKGEFGVSVFTLGCDLRENSAASDIQQWLFANGILVGVLINNAAIYHRGAFTEVSAHDDSAMLRLNTESYVRLAKLFIPLFLQSGGGGVLNVAVSPGAFLNEAASVAEATKAFIASWSEGLAQELEGSSVSICALTGMIPESAASYPSETAPDSLVSHGAAIAKRAYNALHAGKKRVSTGISIASGTRPERPAPIMPGWGDHGAPRTRTNESPST